ncbi:MAG: hypothetical protein CMJ18_09595 [Phycisphaeraceae bacterium]|nr:hypothetical protein [Phycisphaeraceae bacterium]
MSIRVTMIGAGSGFTVAIANTLVKSAMMRDCAFVLMDIDREALDQADARIRRLNEETGGALKITATDDCRAAVAGADFVVASCAPQRMPYWLKDIEIAARHGVDLMQGENGGPAGQIHALRNITMLADLVAQMKQVCPDAWLMNFVNPMSMLCTWFRSHASVRWMGFCHQVHGSFGVVSEMLGMEPGDLQVITAGINHMNFLLDIRRRGHPESYLAPFLEQVRASEYWRKSQSGVPSQVFTLEFLKAFGIYPVGYDNHISEYMQLFYSREEWEARGLMGSADEILKFQRLAEERTSQRQKSGTLADVEVWRQIHDAIPFPKELEHPYYEESPVSVMEALLTGEPLYLDAMVIENRGCVSNLPDDAIVDIPVTIVGGRARGLDVGALPPFAAELCRRQIAVHELVAEAAAEGSRQRFFEALCLDPFVRGMSTAQKIMDDYLEAYRDCLPQFF